MTLSISPAIFADLPALNALRRAVARRPRNFWLGTLLAYADGTLFAVTQDGAIIGTFALTRRKISFYETSWFANPASNAFYLYSVSLRADKRRQGLGRQMMAQIETFCATQGATALRLDTYQDAEGAKAFYLNCIYTPVHADRSLVFYEKILEEWRARQESNL